MALNYIQPALLDRIKQSWTLDPRLNLVIDQLSRGQLVKNRTWGDSLLKRKEKLIVGPDATLRSDILHMGHSSAVGGHSGFKATLLKLKDFFYWKGCAKEVLRLIKESPNCQRVKYEIVAPPGLLQPLPTPHSLFTDISMDLILGLPKV